METAGVILFAAHGIYERSGAAADPNKPKPAKYKIIGICLALGSGLFIGTSFVIKKKGLLAANVKYNEEAGEGYGYLKNAWWWTGMTLMIFGEILNFVAYAFADPILVTPLGALAVVVTTIGSAIFLKERLSFVGKVACFLCILGSVIIVVNAPVANAPSTIQQMQHLVIAPGFLSYTGVIILGSAFLAFWAGPRYGKKSMIVYISICSWIGGLSVVATQGLGAAIITQAGGTAQFNQWFLYVLLVFVVATLVTEIIFLNKALNIFNAALVTPTYYVYFTSTTIITSAVLLRGFKGKPTEIATIVMGFFVICAGVVLLQLSKSAKDVPDAAVFTGDLDQVRTLAEQEQPESEPKADAIRGTAALIRRISVSRQKMEEDEAKRYHDERRETMEPIGEDEQFVWDGIRRRRTQSGASGSYNAGTLKRRKTLHPPLGLTHFPDESEADEHPRPRSREGHEDAGDSPGIMGSFRSKARSVWLPGQRRNLGGETPEARSPMHPVALTEITVPTYDKSALTPSDPYYRREGSPAEHVYGLPSGLQTSDGSRNHEISGGRSRAPDRSGPHMQWADDVDGSGDHRPTTPKSPMPGQAKRQFSFQHVFHRNKTPQSYDGASSGPTASTIRPISRIGLGSRQSSNPSHSRIGSKGATEEERAGLVKGDGSGIGMLPPPDYLSDEEDWQLEGKPNLPSASSEHQSSSEEKELEANFYSSRQQRERRRPLDEAGEDDSPPTVPKKDDGDQPTIKGRRRKGSRANWDEIRGQGPGGDEGRGGGGAGAFI